MEVEPASELHPDVALYLHHTAVCFAKTRGTCSAQEQTAVAKKMVASISNHTMDFLRARALHTFALLWESSGEDEGQVGGFFCFKTLLYSCDHTYGEHFRY
jgi:hypothetical protein